MNWRLSALDRFQLISNSDAHSPAKLGREANLLDTELSYAGLKRAVETGNGLAGTIEFFPDGIWCDIQYFIGVCDHVSESILSLSTVSCPIEKQRHFPADAFQRPSRTSRPVSGSP